MSHRSFVSALLLLGASLGATAEAQRPVTAQPAKPRLWLVPRADTVFVFVLDQPARFGGFTVARSRAGDTTVLLTREPILRPREPAVVAARLGSELAPLQRAIGASSPTELVRRLESDPFVGTLAAALYRDIGLALGRLYIDAGVRRGSSYEYRIDFIGADGRPDPRRSPAVARVSVADNVLAPPAAPSAEGHDGRATVAWTYPRYAGDGRDNVIAFTVWRADGERAAFHRVSETPVLRNTAVPRLSFTDSGLTGGVRYRYQIRSIDLTGREGAPSAEVATTSPDRTPPAMPEGVRAEAGDNHVVISWRTGGDNDLAGYWIERSLSLDRPFTRLNRRLLPLGENVFTDTVITGPWQHFYRLVAVDTAGNESRPSNAIGASPRDTHPPIAPSALEATVAQRRVTIRWQPSPSGDVLGYYVYRGDAPARLVRLTSKPIRAAQFVDSGFGGKGLAPGGSYILAASAVDFSFNESAKISTPIAIPDDDAPLAPTALVLQNVHGRRVDLSWSASPSLDVVAYLVARASSDSTPRTIARVAAGAPLAVRDTEPLVHGRTYRYRVLAEDRAGNRSVPTVDSIRFVDFVPPSPTRHVSAAFVDGGGVLLQWEPVIDDELAGFNVYRATLPNAVPLRLTPTPIRVRNFVDRAGRGEHWYIVRAVDRSGNESRPSEPVRASTRVAAIVPPSPQKTPLARPRAKSDSLSKSPPRAGLPRPRDPGTR